MHKPHHGTTSTWNARPQHCQPVMHKPHCGTTPTQNARPHHHQPLMTSTQCTGPHHHAAMPTHHTGPCHHAIPNMVCKMEQQWGWWQWWTVGWQWWGWQQQQGTPTYLRLYIFYLCNKLILFLYFVIKANNILLLLSITDVKSNNNK